MRKTNIPEPIAEILYSYCNVNGMADDWPKPLQRVLDRPEYSEKRCLFKRQLADAISNNTISLSDYERLTDDEFDTEEDLVQWLRKLWVGVFGSEPIKPE